MIAYFDTSALVPLLISEPTSASAAQLWDAADRVVSVRLAYPEARAALAAAERLQRVTTSQLRAAVDRLDNLATELDVVEVTATLARDAGDLAEQLELRGYDAVHLAAALVVRDPDLVVVAGDQALRAAARGVGLHTATLS